MSENDKDKRAFDPGDGPTPPDHASENSGFQADPNQPVNAELLSAYLDNPDDLEPETRRRIEQELATSAEARRTLHELEAIVNGLHSLPDVVAPRSYHLTPEMVGAPEPVKLRETRAWYVRHSEAVRWATAAAAILFIFVFTADLVTNGIGPGSSDQDTAGSSTEQTTLRSADGGQSGGDDDAAADASGASEAEMQPVPEEEAASDSGAAPTATPAAVEAEDDSSEAAGGGSDGQEAPPQDDVSATSAEADGEVAESEEEAPVTLNAPDEAATETGDEAVPDRDQADTASDDDSAADTGVAEAQQDTFTMAAEDADEGGSDSRTAWRAVEFSLIFILALLLTIMIILPRLDRMPPESRGRRR